MLPSVSEAMARKRWLPEPRLTVPEKAPVVASAVTVVSSSPSSIRLLSFRSLKMRTLTPGSAVPLTRRPVVRLVMPSLLSVPVSSKGLSDRRLGGGSLSSNTTRTLAVMPGNPSTSMARASSR